MVVELPTYLLWIVDSSRGDAHAHRLATCRLRRDQLVVDTAVTVGVKLVDDVAVG